MPNAFSHALAPRAPWRKWNVWSAVVLLREGPFHWVKTHCYLPAKRRRGSPLATMGGFTGEPQSAWMGGLRGDAFPLHYEEAHRPELEPEGLTLHHGGWSWAGPDVVISGLLSGRETRLTGTRMGAPMPWLSLSTLLVYWSWSVQWRLTWGQEVWTGVGLIEHAHGGYLPLPALVPLGRWQWDLLWGNGDDHELRAGLSGHWMGMGVPLGAFLDVDGAVAKVSGAHITLHSTRDDLPFEWSGVMGSQRYQARRVGKPVRPFPGTAFFGFRYVSAQGEGIGFTQCGGNPVTVARRSEAGYPAWSPQG